MGDNYQGKSWCIFPSDTEKCTPGLYASVSSLQGVAGKIASARRGCYGGEQIRNNLGTVSSSSAAGAFGILHTSGNLLMPHLNKGRVHPKLA